MSARDIALGNKKHLHAVALCLSDDDCACEVRCVECGTYLHTGKRQHSDQNPRCDVCKAKPLANTFAEDQISDEEFRLRAGFGGTR